MAIYITKPIQESCGQINLGLSRSYMEIYNALLNGEAIEFEPTTPAYVVNHGYTHVRTSKIADGRMPVRNYEGTIRPHLAQAAMRIPNTMFASLSAEYTQFQIPKRTGGYRTIDAPSESLKQLQRAIVTALTYDLGMHPHESAHAYIKGRSPKTSLEVHQANKSKWFLKLDIKDFFPSCTPDFVIGQLRQLYPLCLYRRDEMVTNFLRCCFLNDALPQGAVTSPLLSNLVMLPIDFAMRRLREEFHQVFVYTRYADDILISSEFDFDFHAVETFVAQEILKDTPLKIKHEKTRYGSIAGQNWNLGLMLNKDNAITVGSQRKTEFKRSVFNLLMDYKKNVAWSTEDKLHLRGILSYIHNIEPEYADGVIKFYENKLDVSWKDAIRTTEPPARTWNDTTLYQEATDPDDVGVPF